MSRKVSLLSAGVLSAAASVALAEPLSESGPLPLLVQQMERITAAGTAEAGALSQGDRVITRTSARVNNVAMATGVAIAIGGNTDALAEAATSGSKNIVNKNINIKLDNIHVNVAVSSALK
jgi:hypothetical protein